jgi:hypothetical protein
MRSHLIDRPLIGGLAFLEIFTRRLHRVERLATTGTPRSFIDEPFAGGDV